MPFSPPSFKTLILCIIAVYISTRLLITVDFLYANREILCNNAKYQRPLLFITKYEEIHQSNKMTYRLKPYQIRCVRITRHTYLLHAYYCGFEALNIIGTQNYHPYDNLAALCHEISWQLRSPRRQRNYFYIQLKLKEMAVNGA
jgi:hypothetical protein